MVRELCCEEFDLHADICHLDSGNLATDYMSFLLYMRNSIPKHDTKQT